jgi:hypothetical protein
MVYYCRDCHQNWEDAVAIFEWRYVKKIPLKKCPKCVLNERDRKQLGSHPEITIIDDPIGDE